ncbi:MerR family transcriptional regulator [Thalassotalea crassostreae]|uniref:MerR family transcriptional regulator n=1 Tax=Thalassotalea crassostreae TaxID=1763536 RepID=UPI000837AD49|nr:MerR family transcriptional regulator [Thalassotalea crassostreae]
MHNDSNTTFDLNTLCQLADITPRKVRYYIQREMVSSPIGARKTARYSNEHLEQLLTIRKWQEAGLSLEKIQAILQKSDVDDLPPEPLPEPGSISVVSQVMLAKGVTLQIDANQAQLTTKQLRALAQQTIKALEQIVQAKPTLEETAQDNDNPN